MDNPWTIRALCTLLREHAPYIIFLMETRLTMSEWNGLKNNFSQFNVFFVDPNARGGGLTLLWRIDLDCRIYSMERYWSLWVGKDF